MVPDLDPGLVDALLDEGLGYRLHEMIPGNQAPRRLPSASQRLLASRQRSRTASFTRHGHGFTTVLDLHTCCEVTAGAVNVGPILIT